MKGILQQLREPLLDAISLALKYLFKLLNQRILPFLCKLQDLTDCLFLPAINAFGFSCCLPVRILTGKQQLKPKAFIAGKNRQSVKSCNLHKKGRILWFNSLNKYFKASEIASNKGSRSCCKIPFIQYSI